VEFYFASSLQFVRHAWVLLGEYVIAAKSADTTLYGFLSFRIFRLVLVWVAGIAVLRQEKAARKQQSEPEFFHGDLSFHS
jgi:hypothetical protein